MKYFFLFLFVFATTSLLIWLQTNRKYLSSSSVASAYDKWTNDKLLEKLWGEHVHLGYYNPINIRSDFRKAKEDFVHQLVSWSGLDNLPKGSRILDVGCGIGGSARILARDYGFDVIGVTISKQQVSRARELTPENINCTFQVMDALDLKYDKGSFDGVWSVEAGPHMPDKQKYADEMLRVLRPGGVLAVADWNKRNLDNQPFNLFERLIMSQLLNQWSHPEFASISGFRNNLLSSKYCGSDVDTDDWTLFTLPSWLESIYEGFRRPQVVIGLGPRSLIHGLREIPTILLMHFAFSRKMMQFGIFKMRG